MTGARSAQTGLRGNCSQAGIAGIPWGLAEIFFEADERSGSERPESGSSQRRRSTSRIGIIGSSAAIPYPRPGAYQSGPHLPQDCRHLESTRRTATHSCSAACILHRNAAQAMSHSSGIVWNHTALRRPLCSTSTCRGFPDSLPSSPSAARFFFLRQPGLRATISRWETCLCRSARKSPASRSGASMATAKRSTCMKDSAPIWPPAARSGSPEVRDDKGVAQELPRFNVLTCSPWCDEARTRVQH
jgi:hypothetical protein